MADLPALQPVNIQQPDFSKTMLTVAALKEAQLKNAMTQYQLGQMMNTRAILSGQTPGPMPGTMSATSGAISNSNGSGAAQPSNAMSASFAPGTYDYQGTANRLLSAGALDAAKTVSDIGTNQSKTNAETQAKQIDFATKSLDYGMRQLSMANLQTYPQVRASLINLNPSFAQHLPDPQVFASHPNPDQDFEQFKNYTIQNGMAAKDKLEQMRLNYEITKPDVQLVDVQNADGSISRVAVDKKAIGKQMQTGQSSKTAASSKTGQVNGLPATPPYSLQQNPDGTVSWKPNAAASGAPPAAGATPAPSSAPASSNQTGSTPVPAAPSIAAAAALNNASGTQPGTKPPSDVILQNAGKPFSWGGQNWTWVGGQVVPAQPATAAPVTGTPAPQSVAQAAPPPVGNPAIMPLNIGAPPKTGVQSDLHYQQLVKQDTLAKQGLAPALTPEQKAEMTAYADQKSKAGVMRMEALGDIRQQQVLDTQNGNTPTFKTVNEIKAEPGRYIPVGEGSKALNKTALVEDIRGSIQDTRSALANMPDFTAGQSAQIALAMKSRDPRSALSTFFGSEVGKTLSPAQQDYLIHLAQLQEVGMSLRSALNSGQGAEDMRRAFSATIPGASTPTKEYAAKQLNALEDVLNRVSRGIPKVSLPPTAPKAGTQPGAPAATPQANLSPVEAELMRRGYKNVNGQWVK